MKAKSPTARKISSQNSQDITMLSHPAPQTKQNSLKSQTVIEAEKTNFAHHSKDAMLSTSTSSGCSDINVESSIETDLSSSIERSKVVEKPTSPARDITSHDLDILRSWNNGTLESSHSLIHELIKSQTDRTPDTEAVCAWD